MSWRGCWIGAGALLLVAACGSKGAKADDDDGAGSSGGGGNGGAGAGTPIPTGEPGQPPAPPANGAPPDGPGHVYAISRMFLGLTDRSGTPSPSAWQQYGFNLDGQISTSNSTDVCRIANGGPPSIHQDGPLGIDNSWGKTLMPIFEGLDASIQQRTDNAFQAGDMGYLIEVQGLGAHADYLGLGAAYYEGAPLGAPPRFDGTDAWPPTAESLATDGSPLFAFGSSYLTNHTLVTLPPRTIALRFDLSGDNWFMNLPIHNAIIVMDIAPNRSAAARGTIAGVIEAEAMVEELRKVFGAFDPELCTGTTFQSIADQIRQAADMPLNGSHSPFQTCDAISIGLGFEAIEVTLAPPAAPAPPAPDPCAPTP